MIRHRCFCLYEPIRETFVSLLNMLERASRGRYKKANVGDSNVRVQVTSPKTSLLVHRQHA